MKIPPSRRERGFTLVELLVVIAIIAVLASAGFAAGNAAIQKAKKVTALASATAIESAVNNFFTEYGSMPKDGTSDTKVKTDTDVSLITVLLGLEGSGAGILNTRAVKFLSVKEGKANKGGLIYNTNGTSVKGLYDPWGGEVMVAINGFKSNQSSSVLVDFNNGQNDRRLHTWGLAEYKETKPKDQSYVFWSYGKDRKKGKKAANNQSVVPLTGSDDVISW